MAKDLSRFSTAGSITRRLMLAWALSSFALGGALSAFAASPDCVVGPTERVLAEALGGFSIKLSIEARVRVTFERITHSMETDGPIEHLDDWSKEKYPDMTQLPYGSQALSKAVASTPGMKGFPSDMPPELRIAAENGIKAMHDLAGFKSFIQEMLGKSVQRQEAGAPIYDVFKTESNSPTQAFMSAIGDEAKLHGFGDAQGNVFQVLQGDLLAGDVLDPSTFRANLKTGKLLIEGVGFPDPKHGSYAHGIGMLYLARAIDQSTGVRGTGARLFKYMSEDSHKMDYWSANMDAGVGTGKGPFQPEWITQHVIGNLGAP